jgi:hypothetical protein
MDIPGTLKDKLELARQRVQSYRRWRVWLGYCLPASACCLGFAVVARLVYVPYFAVIFPVVVLSCLAAATILAWRHRADAFTAAVQLDLAVGLKERLSTLVEVSEKGGTGEIAEALLHDAVAVARDVSPQESLVFHAPRTLPVTLVFTIAAAAAIFAPRTLAHSESALPPVVRVALKEAVRMDTTADMLNESGAPQDIVEQVENLSRLLKKSGADSVEITLQAVRVAQAVVQEKIRDATNENRALEELLGSETLGKLTDLLSENAPAGQVSAEADAVIEKHAPEAMKLLKELLGKLTDTGMQEKLREALKALEERDRKAFVRSMEEFAHEARRTAGMESLEMTRSRLAAVAKKLGAVQSGVKPAAHTDISPGKNGSAALNVSNGTALEEAMEKENVPERFRSLVSVYFARSNAVQRRSK